jgi:hypothetical protein
MDHELLESCLSKILFGDYRYSGRFPSPPCIHLKCAFEAEKLRTSNGGDGPTVPSVTQFMLTQCLCLDDRHEQSVEGVTSEPVHSAPFRSLVAVIKGAALAGPIHRPSSDSSPSEVSLFSNSTAYAALLGAATIAADGCATQDEDQRMSAATAAVAEVVLKIASPLHFYCAAATSQGQNNSDEVCYPPESFLLGNPRILPLAPVKRTHPLGLANPSGDSLCYLNCVVQQLFMLPSLRRHDCPCSNTSLFFLSRLFFFSA